MAENILNDPVHPDAAISFAREIDPPSNNVLNLYLPDKTIQDYRVEITNINLTTPQAEYRAWDGNVKRFARDNFKTEMVGLQPLGGAIGTGEFERLQLEKLRQAGGSDAAMAEAIYNDIERGVLGVHNRVEVARGQLLSTGRVLINENGVNLEADYGVPDEHFVNPDVEWTNTEDSTPIDDLLEWVETYADSFGQVPGGILVSTRTKALLRKNQQLWGYINPTAVNGGPRRVTNSDISSALAEFDLPPLLATYDQKDRSGNRIIPEGKVIFVPQNPADLGNTYWGITQTARDLINAKQTDMSFSDAPGIVGVVYTTGFPALQEVFIDAVSLPVLNNPKALFVADINTPAGS